MRCSCSKGTGRPPLASAFRCSCSRRLAPGALLQEDRTGAATVALCYRRTNRRLAFALPPVAGACYRGMRTPVAAGPRRWLQVRPLQEHCAAAGGLCLLQGYATPVAAGPRRWLQVRPLQEHSAGAGGLCLLQGYANPCSSRTTALAAGAAATGALRWRRWLVPATGVCHTPVAAGPRRWLQVRPLQEHSAGAGGWCLLQGYANPCSSRTTALAAGAAATGALRWRRWLVPATGVCEPL